MVQSMEIMIEMIKTPNDNFTPLCSGPPTVLHTRPGPHASVFGLSEVNP